MNITGSVWMELTHDEKMVVLQFAAEENRKKWKKKANGGWIEIMSEEEEVDIERLDKLYIYFDHFEVGQRYGISFKEFIRRVDNGTWDAYLAIKEK